MGLLASVRAASLLATVAVLSLQLINAQYDERYVGGPSCRLDRVVPETLYWDAETQSFKRPQDFDLDPDIEFRFNNLPRIRAKQCFCARAASGMALDLNEHNETRAKEQEQVLRNAFCPDLMTSCSAYLYWTNEISEDGTEEDYHKAYVTCEADLAVDNNATGVFLPISVIMLALMLYKCSTTEQGFLVRRHIVQHIWSLKQCLCDRKPRNETASEFPGQETENAAPTNNVSESGRPEAPVEVDNANNAEDPVVSILDSNPSGQVNSRRRTIADLPQIQPIPHREFTQRTLDLVQRKWPGMWDWLVHVTAIHMQHDFNYISGIVDTFGNDQADGEMRLMLQTMTVDASHLENLDDDDDLDEEEIQYNVLSGLVHVGESQLPPNAASNNESLSTDAIRIGREGGTTPTAPNDAGAHSNTREDAILSSYGTGLSCVPISPLVERQPGSRPNQQRVSRTCAICLDSVEVGDVVGKIYCGHLFHKDCLKTWLLRENKCPMCQRPNIAKIEATTNNDEEV